MKEPGFYLYVNNIIGGTQHMTNEQFGAYVRLLFLQFNRTKFTMDEAVRIVGPDLKRIWPGISDKFIHEGQLYYNQRMYNDREKSKKKSDAGKKGNEVRWGKSQNVSQNGSQNGSDSHPLSIDTDIELKKNTENDNDNEMYKSFIAGFNELTGRNFRGDQKAKRQFRARLKDKYTGEDFALAIMNCLNDKFHRDNPHFLTPEFITRQDKLEKYINWKPSPTELKRARDVMFNLNKLFDDEQTSEN